MCHTATHTGVMTTRHTMTTLPAPPAATARRHRQVSRGPSYTMAAVASWQSSIVPPGHCVPGIPDPHPLPPYSYLYTGSSGTTTWQVPLAAAAPWPPTALPVPATLSRLYRYRYGYAAGPMGVQRTPGSCSLRPVPVPSPCLFRYGYVAGHLREQRAVGHHFYCPRHRLPFIVPPIVPPIAPWTPGLTCRHFYRCSLLTPELFPRFSPLLPFFLVYEFVIP